MTEKDTIFCQHCFQALVDGNCPHCGAPAGRYIKSNSVITPTSPKPDSEVTVLGTKDQQKKLLYEAIKSRDRSELFTQMGKWYLIGSALPLALTLAGFDSESIVLATTYCIGMGSLFVAEAEGKNCRQAFSELKKLRSQRKFSEPITP